MASSKIKIFLYRSAGALGWLLLCSLTIRLFFLESYIWAVVYVALNIWVLYRFFKDYSNPKTFNNGNYSLLICMIFPCYHEYTNYKRDVRLDKFGPVYNKTREVLGIPIIPTGWHTESRGNKSVDWRGKEGVLGHEEKYIALDSLYRVEYERDEYNFKAMHDTTRSISIFFKYARGKGKDSIFYWYDRRDTTLNISRRQADSIFDVEKIRKDY
jgi:hypothetical protein